MGGSLHVCVFVCLGGDLPLLITIRGQGVAARHRQPLKETSCSSGSF